MNNNSGISARDFLMFLLGACGLLTVLCIGAFSHHVFVSNINLYSFAVVVFVSELIYNLGGLVFLCGKQVRYEQHLAEIRRKEQEEDVERDNIKKRDEVLMLLLRKPRETFLECISATSLVSNFGEFMLVRAANRISFDVLAYVFSSWFNSLKQIPETVFAHYVEQMIVAFDERSGDFIDLVCNRFPNNPNHRKLRRKFELRFKEKFGDRISLAAAQKYAQEKEVLRLGMEALQFK